MEVYVNYWVIIVAAVANMALGFVWYGPLFGKIWISLMAFTPEKMEEAKKKGMTKTYVIAFAGSLLMAFVLYHAIVFASYYLEVTGISAGLQAAFWNWIGFVVPVTLSSLLWEGKSLKLWFLNIGYYLVSLVLMGVILSYWM